MKDDIKEYFNEVRTEMTAVCRSVHSWAGDDCSGLEIGKTYHVSHIGVLRSKTNIMLKEFGNKRFNSTCFDLFENGESIDNSYTDDPRFLAPYLRRMYRSSRHDYIENIIEKESIPKRLCEIERKYDVKVLLAVESGSRAWGFASKDSDWDVRFIYVHKPNWYFSIDDQRDVIEEVYEEDIDAVGWDIKKALALLKRSNPSLLEWINSPIIYRSDEQFMAGIIPLAKDCFTPTKAMYHYQRIYVKHDERYLQKQGYPMKRFMYYLRGLLACQWIEKHKTMPPVSFQELYEEIVEDQKIKDGIKALVKAKSSGKEMDMSEVPQYMVDFYLPLAEYYSNLVGKFRPNIDNEGITERLNRFFYEMVTGGVL
jgi:predicted nucleotidyltransferase